MFNFFNKKIKENEDFLAEQDGVIAAKDKESGIIRISMDKEAKSQDVREMVESFAAQSEIKDIFKGNIENAYESDFLGYKDKCPVCSRETKQMYSGFVYATQTKARVASGPCGHFCTKCPTVIIDDDMMRQAVSSGFKYGGTVAIETGYAKETILFKKFNGVKPVYVLGEDGGMEGITDSTNFIKHEGSTFLDNYGMPLKTLADYHKKESMQKKKDKARSKNRQAKKARSSNRKK
jgi:hypothetical protein